MNSLKKIHMLLFLLMISCGDAKTPEGEEVEIQDKGAGSNSGASGGTKPKSSTSTATGDSKLDTTNCSSSEISGASSSPATTSTTSGKASGTYSSTTTSGSAGKTTTATMTASSTSKTNAKTVIENQSETVTFSGYVNGIFEVTVDGIDYDSLEDFYNQELAVLPQKVKKAGYDTSYAVKFDAKLGYKDFWKDMDVYISPVTNRGYQGHDTLDKDGQFGIVLPAAAQDKNYKVKANKRISVILTSKNDTKELCYNFYAVERNIAFSQVADPIILTNFSTELTSYGCSQAKTGGIAIPGAAPKPAAKIAKDISKDEVRSILGTTGLKESQNQWCWVSEQGTAKQCKAEITDECHCYITFDATGSVKEFQGIKAEYIAE